MDHTPRYDVHLEMTHDFAEWLVSLLERAKEEGSSILEHGFTADEIDEVVDAIQTVSDGRYDSAGNWDHFQVTSP